MNLENRLSKLEQSEQPAEGVTLVLMNFVDVNPSGPPNSEAGLAYIIGNQQHDGETLRRDDGESETTFIERVELAHMELHGFRPSDDDLGPSVSAKRVG